MNARPADLSAPVTLRPSTEQLARGDAYRAWLDRLLAEYAARAARRA